MISCIIEIVKMYLKKCKVALIVTIPFFVILFQGKCMIIEEDFLRKYEGELAHEYQTTT